MPNHSITDNSYDILKSKFEEFKNLDISYGTFDGNDCGDKITYEGTKPLYVEDFIEYLKSENRELSINKVIEK